MPLRRRKRTKFEAYRWRFPDDRGDRFGHGLGLLERASGWRVGVENVADVAVVFGVCRSAAVTLGVRQ